MKSERKQPIEALAVQIAAEDDVSHPGIKRAAIAKRRTDDYIVKAITIDIPRAADGFTGIVTADKFH